MIRLQRIGKRGQAYFRVVILEHTVKPKGEYLELLGTYNPHQKEFKVKKDRIEYWVSKGAQISPTVNNLMINYKIWDKPKMQSWKPKNRTTETQKKTEKSENKITEIQHKERSTEKEQEKTETKTAEAQPTSVPAV